MYNQRKHIQDILDGNYSNYNKIKEMGEVFTPFELIEEMLDELPKELWIDSNKTWLDPAAGLGNFQCVIVERLMVGLSDFEPNEDKRYKHIVENQLYFIELNPDSAKLIKKIFDPKNKYKMNLVCADALDKDHSGWDTVGYMWDEADKKRRQNKEKIEQLKLRFFEMENCNVSDSFKYTHTNSSGSYL